MKLLRVEGVNLAHCIDDTENLPARRGGSLMLLDAIESVRQAFEGRLTAISSGASAGLFVPVTGRADTDIVDRVRAHLAQGLFRHGTFVVNEVDGDDFKTGEVAALNANRWQQMQQMSFSAVGLAPSLQGPCSVDEVRPARAKQTVQDNRETDVSSSVAERCTHGRDQKQRFYQQELSHLRPEERPAGLDALTYTRDFADIAEPLPGGLKPASLRGKLAIFYADGNQFGKRAAACESPDALRAWEKSLKTTRRRFLAAVVERARSTAHWLTATGELRLETLLWGGDELLIVVPAWCGLELAALFFEHTRDLADPAGKRLTHACGLVFCHQQAPISRTSQLAKALAEEGKKGPMGADGQRQGGRNVDTLHWLVLESFDHAGGDLDGFLARRYPLHELHELRWSDFELSPKDLVALRGALPALTSRDVLPRSTLQRAARLIAEAADMSEASLALLIRSYQQVSTSIRQAGPDAQAAWSRCWRALLPDGKPQQAGSEVSVDPDDNTWHPVPSRQDLVAWVSLLELWDYCIAPPDPGAVPGQSTQVPSQGVPA